MKYNNIISSLILFFVASMFVACGSDDEQSVIEDNRQVAFLVSEQTPLLRATTGEADFKTTFEEGDAIGIFAVKRKDAATIEAPAASGNYAENVKYVRQANGKWAPDGSPIYYPMDDATLDYYAYSPYDAKASDPTKIDFNVTDQLTNADYTRNDLLTARNTTKPALGSPVVLQFSHKFALVQVEVVSTTINLSNLESVRLANCLSSATLDLSQAISNEVKTKSGDKNTIQMKRVESDASSTTYSFRGVIPAQVLEAGTKIFEFSHKTEGDFSYSIDEEVSLKEGSIKLYKISIESSTSSKARKVLRLIQEA